jgi:excisionase family DNA binding protein
MLTSLAAPPLAQPRLLEVSHIAHRLRASQEHVRRLIREKKLAAIRLGARWRVDPADLQAFIAAQRVPAVPLARGLDGGLDDERARRRVTSSRSELCTRV